MKKTLMKCFATAAFVFASMNAMAFEASDATITIEPISAKLAKVNALDPVGDATMITVVNYSDTNTIVVTFPDKPPVFLTHETSATYKRAGYRGDTHVIIQSAPGDSPSLSWDHYVRYQNVVSVYLRKAGWYVYDSQT